jgi:Phosphopantetheine attachment site
MSLKKLCAFMWPGLLGFSVPKDQPLMEAGLDSVSSVELRNSVASKFGVELPATVTFDHPSVQALAAFVASTIEPSHVDVTWLSSGGDPSSDSRLQVLDGDLSSTAVQIVGLAYSLPRTTGSTGGRVSLGCLSRCLSWMSL